MIPSSDMVEAGQRLASDLRRIRELRGVSIETFLEKTKASPDIITAFEKNALVDHPLYNRVYLRSFVRMYAEAVDIDPDAALAAAEQLLEGRYDGSLATRYLGGGPVNKGPLETTGAGGEAETSTAAALPVEPAEPEAAAEPPPPEAAAGPPPPVQPEDSAPDEPLPLSDVAHDELLPPKPVDNPPVEPTPGEPETPTALPEVEAPETEAGPPGDEPPSPAEEVPPPAATVPEPVPDPRAPGPPPPPASGPLPTPAPKGAWTGSLKWIIPGVIALVIAAMLLFGRSEPEVRETPAIPAEPTPIEPLPPAPVDTTDSIQVRMPPRVALPDSISVWVVAERDTLNPIRVRTDDDIRRPYWIEIGDSTEFRVKDRIALERETGFIALNVAGYRLPLDRFVPGEPIELDRERIQAMLDSLRMVQ
jgi:hypothetical protein